MSSRRSSRSAFWNVLVQIIKYEPKHRVSAVDIANIVEIFAQHQPRNSMLRHVEKKFENEVQDKKEKRKKEEDPEMEMDAWTATKTATEMGALGNEVRKGSVKRSFESMAGPWSSRIATLRNPDQFKRSSFHGIV